MMGQQFSLPFQRCPATIAGRPAGYRRWPATAAMLATPPRCCRTLTELKPDLIEVHNKPDLADRLAGWFSPRRIALFLHNDPRSMRGARTRLEQRDDFVDPTSGRIVCVSSYIAGCWMEGLGAMPRCRWFTPTASNSRRCRTSPGHGSRSSSVSRT